MSRASLYRSIGWGFCVMAWVASLMGAPWPLVAACCCVCAAYVLLAAGDARA